MQKSTLFQVITTTLALFCTGYTYAGAVSGGGGGTTNPKPANPIQIVETVRLYSGKIIKIWLYNEEAEFENLTASEKLRSPFLKFFSPEKISLKREIKNEFEKNSKNIFDQIEQTEIELQMSKPCYDEDRLPKDGSIFASKPGAICISPYLIAPKLNEYNYEQETLALIAHELAHLQGADENEALNIQQEAIFRFNHLDFAQVKIDILRLSEGVPPILSRVNTGGEVAEVISSLEWRMDSPEFLTTTELELWADQYLRLRNFLKKYEPWISLLPIQKFKYYTPQFTRLEVIEDYLCANDGKAEPEFRENCKNRLEKGFRSDSQVTFAEYLKRVHGWSPDNPVEGEMTIQRITNLSQVSEQLSVLRTYLEDLRGSLKDLNQFQTKFDIID